jgi:hypothetical protein
MPPLGLAGAGGWPEFGVVVDPGQAKQQPHYAATFQALQQATSCQHSQSTPMSKAQGLQREGQFSGHFNIAKGRFPLPSTCLRGTTNCLLECQRAMR